MRFSDYKNLAFERRGRVLEITLNRPDMDASLAYESMSNVSEAVNAFREKRTPVFTGR